jgi:hypothetical protein
VKLLILYGAPASGKLTIGEEIAQRTGFSLFHNHLTFSVASSVLPYGTEPFAALCWDLRMAVFEGVANADKAGLIFTWAYSHPEHQRYVAMLELFKEKWGAELLSAYLFCNRDERRRRVSGASRAEVGKVASLEKLTEIEANKNYCLIPNWPSFMIDTSQANPPEVAKAIIDHFSLPVTMGVKS